MIDRELLRSIRKAQRVACRHRRYHTEQDALQRLRALRRKKKGPHRKFTEKGTYHCQTCLGWHLTSQYQH